MHIVSWPLAASLPRFASFLLLVCQLFFFNFFHASFARLRSICQKVNKCRRYSDNVATVNLCHTVNEGIWFNVVAVASMMLLVAVVGVITAHPAGTFLFTTYWLVNFAIPLRWLSHTWSAAMQPGKAARTERIIHWHSWAYTRRYKYARTTQHTHT